MTVVPKRVTLITRQVEFSIQAKEAMERQGEFEVTAFASASNALAHLQLIPQDVVLVDFTVRDMSGERLIAQIRLQQPDIAILVAPDHESVQDIAKPLNVQGFVNLPIALRQFIKSVHSAYDAMYEAQEDTNTLRTTDNLDIENTPQLPSIFFEDTNRTAAVSVDTNQQSEEIFRKLAAEEPPMPDFEESATVRDLISNMIELEINESFENILSSETSATDSYMDMPQEESQNSLATQILETAMDTSTPVNAVVSRVIERLSDSSLPESERWVREPDFLPEDLPLIPSGTLEYTSPTTMINESQLPGEDAGNLDTDRIQPIVRSRPILEGDFPSLPTNGQDASADNKEIEDPLPLHPIILEKLLSDDTDTSTQRGDNPQIAQLALVLTEMSLETTADALILTQGDEFIAYSGRIPRAELTEFRPMFTQVWEGDQQTRIRFINLPSNGADYLLYSIRSQGNFTLSMLFAGMMPIAAIRRQGKRLVDALATVPEPEVIEEIVQESILPIEQSEPQPSLLKQEEPLPEPITIAPVETEDIPNLKLTPFSFVWVLRDPSFELGNKTAQSLVMGLDLQLTRAGWKILNLDVYEDFIYLRTNAPQGEPPNRIIRDLMRVSAELVHGENPNVEPQTLWADSYLVIPSERELGIEEIQNFINFARS